MIVARQLIAWDIPKKSAGPVGTIDYEVDRLMYLGDFRARDQASLRDPGRFVRCPGNKLPGYYQSVPTTGPSLYQTFEDDKSSTHDLSLRHGFNRQPPTAKR
jgi:hypothetical protein